MNRFDFIEEYFRSPEKFCRRQNQFRSFFSSFRLHLFPLVPIIDTRLTEPGMTTNNDASFQAHPIRYFVRITYYLASPR